MAAVERSSARVSADTVDLAFVLLVLQAAFGFVAALGMIVVAVLSRSPALAGGLLVAVAVPSAVLLLGLSVARLHRWAWFGVLGFEAIDLLGGLFRLAVHAYSATTLVGLLTNLVVPALVAGLLLTPSARRAIAGRSTGTRSATTTMLEHAA